ncbi:MAG: hypothetical protein IJH39_07210 [Clostridia bacterium]|nr:hypothetical protein [Clostridia bacterium]
MKILTDLELVKTLRNLEDISIRIDKDHPLRVKWPYKDEITIVWFASFMEYPKTYNSNNEILTFVIDDTAFVVPCFENAWNVIYSTDLKMNTGLYCPLSSMGEYPVDHMDKWENLKKNAFIQKQQDTYKFCKRFSLSKHIIPLDDRVLTVCTEITPEGIYIGTNRVFPFIAQVSDIRNFIGHYNYNDLNNFIIFVHYDGRTYYSFDSSVIIALLESNYVKDPNLTIPQLAFQSI